MENSFISNYILHAVELAKKGRGFVNPNPLVGAVIVKDGKILGEGYHTCCGKMHAEREALADAERRGNSCENADIFVTLEPCCHIGKQPPCTDAIIKSGIKRVFCGSNDPNPLVSGKGFEILRKAGIEVYTECLKSECDALNPVFFHYISTKTPYITMKYAITADGLTACANGKSQWITGELSRKNVHFDRFCNMAVMTGIGTVLADNPTLNCRLNQSEIEKKLGAKFPQEKSIRQPVRIVCDSSLKIPLDCNLVKTADEQPLIVACALTENQAEKSEKVLKLKNLGAKIICVPENSESSEKLKNIKIDLRKLSVELGKLGIDSVLLESGGELNSSALKSKIVNKIQIYIAPKIFGSLGNQNQSENLKNYSPVRGLLANSPDEGVKLASPKISTFGDDILLEYEVLGGGNC